MYPIIMMIIKSKNLFDNRWSPACKIDRSRMKSNYTVEFMKNEISLQRLRVDSIGYEEYVQ